MWYILWMEGTMSLMIKNDFEPVWPGPFATGVIEPGYPDAALGADALCAWACCMMGAKPPECFGRIMAEIAIRLGILGDPESFDKWAKDFLKSPHPGRGKTEGEGEISVSQP